MNKKHIAVIIFFTITLSLLVNIFFGRFLSAEISTLPLLNRWKILSPLTPIVINTREEVRVSDTLDMVKIASSARPKLSAIIGVTGQGSFLAGGAENLTSDGYFLTSKAVLAGAKLENLYIKLDDGTIAPITASFADPATNLVLIKASISNVPVANIASSDGLAAGDKIIFLIPTLKNFSPSFQASFVAQDQHSDYTTIFDSDKPHQSFQAQGTGALLPGQAIVNSNGEVVGIWDGGNIVSGDIIKDFVNDFFGSGGKILRPSLGFLYRNVSDAEGKLLGVSAGAKITKATAGGAAQKSGLLENDTIVSVNDNRLTADNPLDKILPGFRPGDKVKLGVMRGKSQINLNLTVGELK
jgi:serine protease Do